MRILLILLILSSLLSTGNHTTQPQPRVSYSTATSPYIHEFPLPKSQAIPGPIAVAPNGTVWFAETNASSLAKFALGQGFTEFPFRNSSSYALPSYAPQSINSITTDSQGNVWFTFAGANAFGYLNITNRAYVYYNLTQLTHRSSSSFPFGIILDSKGIAWIAETGASRVARFDPSNSSFHEYPLRQPNAAPLEIFEDNNHNLWITSYWYTNGNNPSSGSTLTKFDPTKLQIIQDYNLSAAGIRTPVGVAVDQNGIAWIGDHAGAWLGEVNTLTAEIKLHRTSLPPLNPHHQNLTDRIYYGDTITLVNDVVLGSDGTPWFIEHLGGRVGHYIPANDTTLEYNIPTFIPITLWLAADQTGGIWFTEEAGNKLGYLNITNAAPPFEVTSPSTISSPVTACGSTVLISVKNLTPKPISITAGVENTNGFAGPLTNITISGGASTQAPVRMSSSPSLLQGNYSLTRFADLTPVIKVSDSNVNYPITVFADITDSTICPRVLLYAVAGSILALAGITGTVLFYNKKKNQRPNSLSQT